MMKKAFTLMEVNLAILIMAGGILSILGLYSLGYRENRQSREDVASAAYADAVISPLVMALSATNLKWSSFQKLGSYPSETGWKEYFNSSGSVSGDPEGKAKKVFQDVMSALQGEGSLDIPKSWPAAASGGLRAGLVVLHEKSNPETGGGSSGIVRIAFRATKNPAELLAMPLYYTEVRFQGVIDE